MGELKNFSRRLLVATALASTCALSTIGVLHAQEELASAEAAKRAAASESAHELLEQGDAAYQKNDFNTAVGHYREAIASLPAQAGQVAELRVAAVQRFSQAAVEQARILSRTGDYASANDLLEEVGEIGSPLDVLAAEQQRKKIEDPIRSNPALSKEHSANVDQVRRLLYEANGFMDLGEFDRAEMTFENVIQIDSYNQAARRGIERANWHRSDYAAASYDDTRATMLKDVQAQWESRTFMEVPDTPVINETFGNAEVISVPLVKLRTIQVPLLDLADASLEESVDYLRSLSVQYDKGALQGSPKGVDILLQLGSEDHPVVQEIRKIRVNLQLSNIPLEHALKTICEATRTTYRVDEYAIVIRPIGATDSTLIRREFRVPPDFLSRDAINTALNDEDPFAESGGSFSGNLLKKRFTALQKLKAMGVNFPEGASARYNSKNSSLIVRNTVTNLDLINQYVSILNNDEPVAVIVRTTILEIEDTNQTEMAYDTILNTINVGGSLYLNGGSAGTGSPLSDMINGNPVTSGNRSGGEVFFPNSLDSVLQRQTTGGTATRFTTSPTVSALAGATQDSLLIPPVGAAEGNRAPGILSLQAVIDQNLHQMLLRGVDQKKGVDLMTRPEVITRSGQNAVIKSVRELLYPDEYEPPELPNSIGGGVSIVDGVLTADAAPTNVPITPATPTSFLPTDIGVILEVVPTVSSDRKFVEVSVRPRIRDLLGFINFGTPITGSGGSVTNNLAGAGNAQELSTSSNITRNVLTENAILKPLIRNIEANTTVTVADGHTIVIGGLIREDIETFNDGTPVLKDLPYFGRFFKSHGMRTIKKNLIIMIQVELVDPSGNKIRNR
ncbi:hypothetical protein N9224_00675 [Akkermansiaceae bacterium]|nr:hypothetical protein [Akkermansiaceae bacterium]